MFGNDHDQCDDNGSDQHSQTNSEWGREARQLLSEEISGKAINADPNNCSPAAIGATITLWATQGKMPS
jgi:hypothetical protein